MIADSICFHLSDQLGNIHIESIVHSVFHQAFNIITEKNQFITFLNYNKSLSPSSIRLLSNKSFKDLGIKPNMKIYFYNQMIKIEDLNIEIAINKIEKWNSDPNFTYQKNNSNEVFKKLNHIKYFLENTTHSQGIIPLLTFLKEKQPQLLEFTENKSIENRHIFIKERFLTFIDLYILEDIDQIGDSVKSIIGFGDGLTPSIDDFITGLMISRLYLFDYLNLNVKEALDFNKKIVEQISEKTTRVSEEMLKHSSEGRVNEDIRKFMISILSPISSNDFFEALKNLADFGETSGIDVISGIYIGSVLLFNKYNRG